ncbi:MAG: LamG domain-containing protein, partial [Bryobacteraceae bacterium]
MKLSDLRNSAITITALLLACTTVDWAQVTVKAPGAPGSPADTAVTNPQSFGRYRRVPVVQAPPAPAVPGALADWTFDTGTITGTTVLDTSGDNIYGNIVGKVTPVPGAVNQALSFDGSTNYVYTSPTTSLSLRNDMTIAAWIQTTNSTRTEAIVEDYNTDGSEDGYIFETTAAGYLALHLGGDNIAGTVRDFVDGSNAINNGKWHHVAVIIRPGQDISFYVDGGLSSVYYLTISDASSVNSLGLGGPSLGGAYLFTGSLDEVRIYARALSTSDIAGVYGGTVTTIPGGQVLYNGIAMPKNFPPPTTPTQALRTPYYINNPPRVIPIDIGRQLFVDDFLIAQTTLQ